MRHHFLYALLICLHACSEAYVNKKASNTKWSSWVLKDPFREEIWSETAVAVESFRDGDSIVAVDRQLSNAYSVPAIYKIHQSQEVAWSVQSKLVSGSPFAMEISELFDIAYIVVSKLSGSEFQGHVLRFSGISSNGTSNDVSSKVREAIFFTAESTKGVTKLFDCTINNINGDVYVTGGTSGSLYEESKGKGDVIVVRLSSSGEVLNAVQFGSRDDEFGRAIDISSDGSEIVIAAHRGLEDGGSEASMYRLNAESLDILEGPQMLIEQGATPLFTVSDIAIGPPALDGSVTTFMTGKALAIPDRDVDLFMHVFAVLKNDVSNVPVYVDGTSNGKGVDQGVAVRVATDGNAYCIGSSEALDGARKMLLLVISPTGQIVLLSSRNELDNTNYLEKPTAMTLAQTSNRTIVRYVGYTKYPNGSRPTFGIIFPEIGAVKPFKGFGDVVEEAAVDTSGDSIGDADKEKNEGRFVMNKNMIIVICSAGVGALALAALLAMVVVLYSASRNREGEITGLADEANSETQRT
ncbi:unnamed protein product [Agarophyton chilense]|eukprot:gb/GEZJ01000274.1/.p1 GENE.gb/GEZJ01000274.1/~~gb/GEZJ01000274.1/.p1  ORF type:complete len:524 (+),score=90.83 gb/GEZJ01000274.1/:1828-3399(+)